MVDLKTAEDLINNPLVQKYIENVDKDAQAALDKMNADLGSAEFAQYPGSVISAYKADGAQLEKAWGAFNGEWNKVVFKQATDGKAATAAYSRYVLSLGVLKERQRLVKELEAWK